MLYGVDVSEHNGFVDFDELKNNGVQFVMVRCSYGMNEDSNFLDNVCEANEAGLLVGAYHYSYALTPERAYEEAKYVCDLIKNSGVFLGLPIFLDMEDADGYKARHFFTFDRVVITEMCRAFGETLGLNWGVYASYSWLQDYIDWKYLDCPIWNAEWGNEDDFGGYVWQHTDSLQFDGHTFDGNKMYIEW